ncbi:hypothetical protein BURPS1710b_3207 [Burkholderia pseudomallei 1710b]|uniref:Uncharacterized protein n=1 Tax=Burkholderia pseudomallei (strain 1710b) TaxID=320372 RepID=Q3JPC5_BURP1|nr:hypothetical protein BURPS1710b_3207 [Burkholderia pseudomallei 1710b]
MPRATPRFAVRSRRAGVHRRRISATKNAPPSPAVTMPIGRSSGAASVRAARSAHTSSAAPLNPATGNSRACSAPTSRRHRCGVTSPTKPIAPLTATIAPVANDAITNTSRRIRATGTPSDTAATSPDISAFSSRRRAKSSSAANAAQHAGAASRSQRASPTPPSIQNSTDDAARGSPRYSSRFASAVIMNDTATPASSKRSGSSRPRRYASAITSAVAASAPANAANDSVNGPNAAPRPNVAATAPSIAPELTPSRCGSASRFAVAACSATPTIASVAPTSAASSARGNLICQTMLSSANDAPLRASVSATCAWATCAWATCAFVTRRSARCDNTIATTRAGAIVVAPSAVDATIEIATSAASAGSTSRTRHRRPRDAGGASAGAAPLIARPSRTRADAGRARSSRRPPRSRRRASPHRTESQ